MLFPLFLGHLFPTPLIAIHPPRVLLVSAKRSFLRESPQGLPILLGSTLFLSFRALTAIWMHMCDYLSHRIHDICCMLIP